MKRFYTLKNILLTIFFLSFFIPLIAVILIIPSSYKKQFIEETDLMTESNLELFNKTINSYLVELQKLATFPIFKKDLMKDLEKTITSSVNDDYEHGKNVNHLFKNVIPDFLRISRKDILSIVVIYSDGTVVYSNRNSNVEINKEYDFLSQDWYRDTILGGSKINYIGSHKPEYFTYSGTLSVFSVARIIKQPYSEKVLGVVIADADTKVFSEMLASFRTNVSSVSILLDEENNVLYSTEKIGPETLDKLRLNSKTAFIDEEIYRIKYSVLSPSKWKLAILTSQSDINNQIQWIYTVVIVILSAVFLISFLMFQLLAQRFIAKPIRRMLRVIKEVEKGNLEARFTADTNDELNSLGMSLNEMTKKLNDHINMEYKLVLQQKNAEYRALQAQIQPHFIYNTLNGFLALNRLGKRNILEKSILNLTGMLRYTLSIDEDTTIENEFIFLEKYCALQKLRFEDRLNYKIYNEDEIKNIKIPRLLVQPLVENAVKYGVEPLAEECSVVITAERFNDAEKSFIKIIVKDTGAGFDSSRKTEESIGLSNIKERLNILYRDSILKITSEPGKGTEIRILIPMESAG